MLKALLLNEQTATKITEGLQPGLLKCRARLNSVVELVLAMGLSVPDWIPTPGMGRLRNMGLPRVQIEVFASHCHFKVALLQNIGWLRLYSLMEMLPPGSVPGFLTNKPLTCGSFCVFGSQFFKALYHMKTEC